MSLASSQIGNWTSARPADIDRLDRDISAVRQAFEISECQIQGGGQVQAGNEVENLLAARLFGKSP